MQLPVRGNIALAWLAIGGAIMLLAPHSVHNETLGWTATYWLLGVPAFAMLAKAGWARF